MAELAFTPAPARRFAFQRADHREQGAAAALLAPAAFLAIVMLFGPLVAVVLLSFTDWQLGAKVFRFVGFDNYAALFGDRVFMTSLRNTMIYVAVVVPGSVLLGLGTALLIEAGTSLRAFYRAVYFLPVMATLIAMAIVWEFILHPSFGLLNVVLGWVGVGPRNWLQDSATVLPVLCGIGIWQALGFNMVLFMAGLTAIPRDLYDAADMDGVTGPFERFRTVTWPLLGPVTLFVVVMTAIRAFQVFDLVHVLTAGGPSKASEVLLHTMYTEAFSFFRTGYGATIAVVFLGIVFILTLVQNRVVERRVHYG